MASYPCHSLRFKGENKKCEVCVWVYVLQTSKLQTSKLQSPSPHLKVIVTQRHVSSEYDTTLMMDRVAIETRTSRDPLNAAAVFFGSFQWTSCKTVWGVRVRLNLAKKNKESWKDTECRISLKISLRKK